MREVVQLLSLEMWPRYLDDVLNGRYDPAVSTYGEGERSSVVEELNSADVELLTQLLKPSLANVAAALANAQVVRSLHGVALNKGAPPPPVASPPRRRARAPQHPITPAGPHVDACA